MSDAAQLYFLRKRVFQQPVSQPHFIPSHASASCSLSRTDAASIADPYDEIIKFNVKLTSPSCQHSHFLVALPRSLCQQYIKEIREKKQWGKRTLNRSWICELHGGGRSSERGRGSHYPIRRDSDISKKKA